MAKIEMDISEYEALKENKALLQESLNRERELAEKIDKLNQEKIEVMEANAKSVTIIEEKIIHYYKYLKVEPNRAIMILRNFVRALEGGSSSMMAAQLGHLTPESALDYLLKELFEEIITTSYPAEDKRVSYKGLDEIKKEIEKNLNEQFKKEIDSIARLKSDKSVLLQKYKDTDNENAILIKANTNLTKENDKFKKIIDKADAVVEATNEFVDEFKTKVEILQDYVNTDINILNYNIYKQRLTKFISTFPQIINILEKNESNIKNN